MWPGSINTTAQRFILRQNFIYIYDLNTIINAVEMHLICAGLAGSTFGLIQGNDMSNEWISVDDKLPPKSTHEYTHYVMIWPLSSDIKVPYVIARAKISNGVNSDYCIECWENEYQWFLPDEVESWQPLPSPPETGEK